MDRLYLLQESHSKKTLVRNDRKAYSVSNCFKPVVIVGYIQRISPYRILCPISRFTAEAREFDRESLRAILLSHIMPDGRFISRSIAVSRQLKQVSLEADFLFTRTIPHLDRDGRIDGDPDVIRATVCPLRSELTPEIILRCLEELARAALIVRYIADGVSVVIFPGFPRHQHGMKYDRERPSHLPSPDLVRINSGPSPDLVRDVADLVLPSEVKLSKGELSITDDVGLEDKPPRNTKDLTDDERSILNHYTTTHPRRKTDEKNAKRYIGAGLKKFSVDELKQAVDGNAKDPWHIEKRKHELSYVFRNAEMISSFIEKARPEVLEVDADGDPILSSLIRMVK